MDLTEAVDRAVRCSAFARAERLDPVGTAGTYAGFLLIDWPLPWPRDVADIDELAPVLAAAGRAGVRVQAVVPEGPAARVVLHATPAGGDGWFDGYRRAEATVRGGSADVVAAALDLLAGGAPVASGPVASGPVDVLVCGHGRRDSCCGSMGTALALAVPGARRTSHTGGHRFAPTGFVLPDGTAWAYLDGDAFSRVLARRGPLDDLLARYRGCTGLGPPAVQAAEREAFRAIGWGWLDRRRRGVDLGGGRVRIETEAERWEATVEVARMVPVPDCGRPLADAKKAEPEWRVTAFERV